MAAPFTPFRDAFLAGAAGDIADAVDQNAVLLVTSVAAVTARDLSGVNRLHVAIAERDWFYRRVPGSIEAHDPPNVLHDNAGNVFELVSRGWKAVAVSGGQAAPNMDDNNAFKIEPGEDTEIQVPANALPNEAFAIWIVPASGGHSITLNAAGYVGADVPPILNGAGSETFLSGIMRTATTAVISLVKHI